MYRMTTYAAPSPRLLHLDPVQRVSVEAARQHAWHSADISEEQQVRGGSGRKAGTESSTWPSVFERVLVSRECISGISATYNFVQHTEIHNELTVVTYSSM